MALTPDAIDRPAAKPKKPAATAADARNELKQLKADFEAKARVIRRKLHTLKAEELA